MTLQRFIRNGSDARGLIDDEQCNLPQLVRHASWRFLLKVCGESLPMIVKPGGHLNHVKPAGVANERALAPLIRDEVLFLVRIRRDQYKFRVKLVVES